MKIKIIYLIILPLFLMSCEKNGLFNGGETTTREVKISNGFSRIETTSIFDISVINDTINKVLITCGENLVDAVSIKEIDGIIYISHSVKYEWSRKYEKIKLELHINQDLTIYAYQPVYLTTIGTFTTGTFMFVDWGKFCEVNVDVNVVNCLVYMGADSFGFYKVKGKCNYSEIWAGGSSKIYADSLAAQNCYVRQRGWGNVYVNTVNQLKVRFECSSNIYYKGNPAEIIVDQQLSKGNVIKLDAI